MLLLRYNDTITSRGFMSLRWEHGFDTLDQITKTNLGCQTQKVDISADTYTIGASNECGALNKIVF